jgi:hypoxanthine phosphoribosyltransferase
MPPDLLIPAPTLSARVQELGAALSAARGPEPLVLLALLDGAFIFAADLARAIPDPDLTLVFRRASSYRGTVSTGTVELEHPPSMAGADVWVIDDILDTGLTLAAATAACRAAGAARVRTCVCLDKPTRRAPGGLATADLTGFIIADRFVVGYGLDLDGKWRHLPEVRAF